LAGRKKHSRIHTNWQLQSLTITYIKFAPGNASLNAHCVQKDSRLARAGRGQEFLVDPAKTAVAENAYHVMVGCGGADLAASVSVKQLYLNAAGALANLLRQSERQQ